MDKVLSVKVSEEHIKQFQELSKELGIQQKELLPRLLEQFQQGNTANSPENKDLLEKLTLEIQEQALKIADLDTENTILKNRDPETTNQVNPDFLILETTAKEKELVESITNVWGKIKNKTFTPKEYLINEFLIKLISTYPKAIINVPVEFYEIMRAYESR